MDLRALQARMQTNAVMRFVANGVLLSAYRTYVFLKKRRRWFYMAYQKNWMLDPAEYRRYKCWRRCGAHINGKVFVGYDVYFDASHAEMITIDNGAIITSRCLILCHKRDMKKYAYGSDINDFPYVVAPVHICSGAHIGMGSIIMPGVTVGEGAIIGAGAVVTRDVPPYSLAVGQPARVVKTYQKPQTDEID